MLHVSGIVANVMIVNLQTFLVTEDTVVRLQNNFINSYVFGWSMFPSVLMEVCFPVFWWKYVSHCFGWSMFPTVLVEVCFPLFWWKYVSHCFDGWPIFTLAESHDWLSLCYLMYRKHCSLCGGTVLKSVISHFLVLILISAPLFPWILSVTV